MMNIKKSIKKWLYSYPDDDDMFGVNIRKTYQQLYPCIHHWYMYKGGFRRKCTKCWKHQYKFYCRYGDNRLGWRELPRQIKIKDSLQYDYK